MFQLLTVPGYTGSGPSHWQSYWEREDPTIRRVEQADWNRPDMLEWPRSIGLAIASSSKPTVLVGHSCGVTAIAMWACNQSAKIAGAFLVAPADPDSSAADEIVASFGPVPRVPFEFPTLVVASDDDPYCSIETAAAYARSWEARIITIGAAGHINTASGHGPWPQGRALLDAFCTQLGAFKGSAGNY